MNLMFASTTSTFVFSN